MDIPEEVFNESEGVGSISFYADNLLYRYDDAQVELVRWPLMERSEFASVTRAIHKRHKGKTFLIPLHLGRVDVIDKGNDDGRQFTKSMYDALQLLGVGEHDRESVDVDEGSLGGSYRATLRNAALYGERYLVGKSLLQHHDPYNEVPTLRELDELAEELVNTTRAISFATRDGGDLSGTLRIAAAGLAKAVEEAKSALRQK